jgi:PAS domain S-box-containing protein
MTHANNGRTSTHAEVDITSELAHRPARPPDYQAESQALVDLSGVMATNPHAILQKLAETALALCQAESSGISILESDREPAIFRWHATAGKFGPFLGGTTPRDFSPCGVVLDRNATQLMTDPVRFYPYIAELSPHVAELLLLPFYYGDTAVGTIWVVAHSHERKFDGEDKRLLMSLGKFASTAIQVLRSIEAGKQSQAEITRLRDEERAANGRAVRILESVTDAFFALDRDWRFSYFNPQAETLLQRTRDELLGKVIWQAFPQALGTKFEREYRAAVAERRPVTFHEFYPAPLNDWFEVHAYPSDDGLSVYFQNITARKRAEEELRTSQGQLRLALDSAGLGSWHLDPVTVTLQTDERFRAIFGTTAEMLDYDEAVAVIHPDDQARVRDAVAAAIRPLDPAPYAAEYRVIHPDGTVRWVFAKGRANFINEGAERKLLSIDGTVLDITDRKQAEHDRERLMTQLQEYDQQKNNFLATLAHELRNPLAAISNAVLLMDMSDSKQHRDYSTATIKRQNSHLSRLIDDLLDVSRINQGKLGLRREILDATVILDSAVQTVEPLVAERQHTLDMIIDRGNLWVDADPTRLEQIIINLLTNAAKYSENGGHICLSAGHEGREIVIRVKDTGIGIAPKQLPNLFGLFSQVDHNSSRSEGGLGIGLSIVRKLVELHGGEIAVTSDGLGRGSEFTIRLPAATALETVPPMTKETEEAPGKTRILVVDDNADTVRGMEILLKLAGHQVVTARNGSQAIEVAQAHQPQCILLDLGLPGMSGYEVVKRLRQEDNCKNALIIAISGFGQPDDRHRTKAAGFDHHLVKPISYDELFSLLATKSKRSTLA